MAAFKARHVANSLLQRGFKEARSDMSPMKIQKLMFYLNGWHLAMHGTRAIDISFEPWRFGPVVPLIYDDLKCFGSSSVNRYISEHDPVSGEMKPYVVNSACEAFYEVLDIVWEKYIGINAINLSAMTHEPGSPWDQAIKEGLSEIPEDKTQAYFEALARTPS